MKPEDFIIRFSDTTENRRKAIFNTLFIAGNRLQTLFDRRIPEISLKQFMLLSALRQSPEPLSFTQLGTLLGCSRQNIRKLAEALRKKDFVVIRQSPQDMRALCVCPTEKVKRYFENDFAQHERQLAYLFEVYTEEEIKTLFLLLSRLYAGIEQLEKKASL